MKCIKHRSTLSTLLLVLGILVVCTSALAQTFSHVISFQGRLADPDTGKPLPDGQYDVQFTIYDAEMGGSDLWQETQTVDQIGGVFSVCLGSLTPFPSDLFTGGDRWLGIKVGADAEMPDRFRFTPSPWAIYAAQSPPDDDWAVSGGDVYRLTGNVGIGKDNPSERLDIEGTARMTGFQLPTGAAQGYVLTSDAGGIGTWQEPGTGDAWGLTGNAGTDPGINFLGTTDNQPLVIRTNSVEAVRVDPGGFVGIGGLPSSYWRLSVNDTSGGAASFTTTGTGEAGAFQINNTSNSNPAVLATTNGGGEAVKGFTTGPGIAGSFGINNASSTNPALLAATNGLGNAAWIRIDSASNSSAALRSRTFGTGPAGYFEIDNTSNGSAAVEARTNGTGRAIWGYTDTGIAGDFEVMDTSGNGWAVYGHTVGTGSAGVFATTNAGNSEPSLEAFTWGLGPAGKFYINNAANGSAVVDAYTNGSGTAVLGRAGGTGSAGSFINISNANPSPALYAETAGPGAAVEAGSYGEGGAGCFTNWDYATPSPALAAETRGAGSAGIFTNSNVENTSAALVAQNLGLGEAGVFVSTADTNVSPALYAESHGSSHATSVISARYLGGIFDAAAVSGESIPADYYGVGGSFKGGFKGVVGTVSSVGDGEYFGVYGVASGVGTGTNYGVFGTAAGGTASYAGYFEGNVKVTGYLFKDGGGFQIDHPLDPGNMYLNHSFVESPDMKNVYDGVVMLDGAGEEWVELPEWFDVANRDFRYQLTAIGAPGPDLYIAEEIAGNRFRIAGGAPGMKVSWQVTGIRQDPYAEAHRIPVEELKPPHARGLYEHPELYGRPEWEGVGYAARMKAERHPHAR